jgi:hypothetical protein
VVRRSPKERGHINCDAQYGIAYRKQTSFVINYLGSRIALRKHLRTAGFSNERYLGGQIRDKVIVCVFFWQECKFSINKDLKMEPSTIVIIAHRRE